jgi:hypothetical protein
MTKNMASGDYPRVEYLLGKSPALPENMKLSWKGMAGTNTAAYYEKS